MNSNTVEFYCSDTTDLDAVRCRECGSIDFEDTGTRVYCVRCGLVASKSLYSTAGTVLDAIK